ncbi:MAG: LptF/LptG family permease [Bacteroidales bacterium]|nr:LptF/LptG family permease [Bacteroidales bacterium]
MKKIYILALKSYLGPLVLTFFIALFVLLMQFIWKWIDDLVGKGLEWYIIAELLFYASSTFVPYALPLAILLSSLMTFGNLGEHYELVAMKSAGISLKKIMMPLVILSIIISVIAFYFSNNILPIANLKFKSLLFDVREQKLALDIKEGVFYNGLEGYVIRIGKKEKDEKTIHDIMIYDHSQKKGNTNLTTAKSGKMELTPDNKTLIFTLYNGNNYLEKTDQRNYRISRPFQRTKFKEEVRRFSLLDFELNRTNEELFKNNYSMMNLHQLKEVEDSLKQNLNKKKDNFASSMFKNFYFYSNIDTNDFNRFEISDTLKKDLLTLLSKKEKEKIIEIAINKTRRIKNNIDFAKKDSESRNKQIYKHQAEWHRKFTLSFACFVLFFIGAPLGAIIRKGGLGLPVVISVIFFVLFHIVSIIGDKSVKSGVLEAQYGMWLASAILLPIGIFLTYKATTDSPILDTDVWIKFFNKFIKKKKSKRI